MDRQKIKRKKSTHTNTKGIHQTQGKKPREQDRNRELQKQPEKN